MGKKMALVVIKMNGDERRFLIDMPKQKVVDLLAFMEMEIMELAGLNKLITKRDENNNVVRNEADVAIKVLRYPSNDNDEFVFRGLINHKYEYTITIYDS